MVCAPTTEVGPKDEFGLKVVESIANPCGVCASYSWRIAQAWHRHWADQRRQVYGAQEMTAVPRWIAPSVRADLIYGRDRQETTQLGGSSPESLARMMLIELEMQTK
jgi:hypothetical protein